MSRELIIPVKDKSFTSSHPKIQEIIEYCRGIVLWVEKPETQIKVSEIYEIGGRRFVKYKTIGMFETINYIVFNKN